MSTDLSGRTRPTRRLLRCAVATVCLLMLSGCIVYPGGGYYGR